MPRSLCRIAGREPNNCALRINSLGNVSATAAAVTATTSSSHLAAPFRHSAAPLAALAGRSCCLDMKTPPPGGQGSRAGKWSQAPVKLFGSLKKWRRPAPELLEQSRFFRLGGGEMALFDRSKAADLLRNSGQRDRRLMIVQRQLRGD